MDDESDRVIMTDKQFYDNHRKAVDSIESAVNHWKLNVIGSETTMKQIELLIKEMKKEEQTIKRKSKEMKKLIDTL